MQETRFRQRYLDLLVNPEVRQVFKTRAYIISYVRQYLDKLNFIEVRAPQISTLWSSEFADYVIPTTNARFSLMPYDSLVLQGIYTS